MWFRARMTGVAAIAVLLAVISGRYFYSETRLLYYIIIFWNKKDSSIVNKIII